MYHNDIDKNNEYRGTLGGGAGCRHRSNYYTKTAPFFKEVKCRKEVKPQLNTNTQYVR